MDVLRRALKLYSMKVLTEAAKRAGSQVLLANQLGEPQQTLNHWIKRGSFPLKNLPLLATLQGRRLGEILRDLALECDRLEVDDHAPRPSKRPSL